MTRTVEACPECDRTSVARRQTKRPTFRCKKCGHRFDEPVEREARGPHTTALQAKALETMTPEDLDLSPIGERPST